MNFFPPNNGTQSPFVWLASFDECARFAGSLEMPFADGTKWQSVGGRLPFYELGSGREVTTSQTIIPWLVALPEAVCWSVSRRVFVAGEPCAAPCRGAYGAASRILPNLARDDVDVATAHQALLLDLALSRSAGGHGGAGSGAELAAVGEAKRADMEQLRAPGALDIWHATTLAGAGTTSLVEDAYDRDMRDLFAEAAE